METKQIVLKCGCKISIEGTFLIGDPCKEKNCGECKLISQLHPFGTKRIVDTLFRLD